MTHSTSDDNSVLLVHAYLDDELDPANALEIAQRMSADPALAAEGERVKALQQLIHERLPREAAPPHLRARIEASVGGVGRARARPSWRALAASHWHRQLCGRPLNWKAAWMPQSGLQTVVRGRRSRPHAGPPRWPQSIRGAVPSRTDGAPALLQPLRNCSCHRPEDTARR